MADPHEPDPRVGDAIRRSLAGSGAALELEPIATDAVLGRAAQRRRRRRTALAGAALTAVVVVGGAVVATRGDDGTIQTTADTTPPTTAAGANGDASTDESSTDAGAEITTPPTLAPPAPTPAEVGTVAVLGDENVQQLFPWRDGFLAIGYERDPQVLPELPEDIAALFPDEVRALFEEEGLPPTIDEATAMLSEAGLLDEVTQVLADHPEASEAIYAVPADPPRLAAGFSTDGTEWTPVAIDPPHIDLQFTVFDDRLVGWGSPVTERAEGPA
ncbi:MAG: hypothetical protein HKN41_02045, partial [Ilumatobacter sp.]|nr:hypothetical protein [Ilumatobacter sp.]